MSAADIQLTVSDAIRAFIDAPFVAANPTVPIVYENGAIDWNNPAPLFVECEVEFYDGDPIGMSADPRTRLHGCVYVTTYARAGKGSRASRALLVWFSNHLKYQNIGAARLQAPVPDGSDKRKDWFCLSMKLGFYADET